LNTRATRKVAADPITRTLRKDLPYPHLLHIADVASKIVIPFIRRNLFPPPSSAASDL